MSHYDYSSPVTADTIVSINGGSTTNVSHGLDYQCVTPKTSACVIDSSLVEQVVESTTYISLCGVL